MYPYRPLYEHEQLLATIAVLPDSKSKRKEFWKERLLKELSNFDKYCAATYTAIQTNLFRIIGKFTDGQVDLEVIKNQADSVSDFILAFNESIGSNYRFFVTCRYKIKKLENGEEASKKASKFADKVLTKYKFCNIGMGDFVCMLSDIYFTMNEMKKARETAGKPETWVPPSAFVRSTRKYWVRLEDLTRLKLHIAKHLPLLRFGKRQGVNISNVGARGNIDYSQFDNSYSGNGEGDAAKITSVYFDNDKLRLYHDKIVRKEGATLIRIRWYGDEGKTCFMERKTWHDSWVLNDSIKERFDIKWGEVPGYITGTTSYNYFVDKVKDNPKYDHKGLCELLGLSKTIQQRILNLQLKPAIRTTYFRSAFQNSDNNNIRISIDTTLELSREPNNPGPGRWCRDISKGIPDDEKFVFPMAVLEIKLHSITDIPDWISEIVNADYIVGAYKFSKFMHGTAKLNGIKTKRLPAWFTRTVTHVPGCTLKHWYRQSTRFIPNKMDFDGVKTWEDSQKRSVPKILLNKTDLFEGKDSDWSDEEPELEAEDLTDEEDQREETVRLLMIRTKDASAGTAPTVPPMYMNALYDDEDEYLAKQATGTPIQAVKVTGSVKKAGPNLLHAVQSPRKPKKAGVTPVLQARRAEPKTNLALERTFLNWQRLFAFICTLSLLLLPFAPAPHNRFVLNLSILALMVSLYGIALFLIRRKAIQVRSVDGHYDDKYGPTIMVVVIALCIAMVGIWQLNISYLVAPIPITPPSMRIYRVPVSLANFSGPSLNVAITNTLNSIQTYLSQHISAPFSIQGTLSREKGKEQHAFWDTSTCLLYRNSYVLRSIVGTSSTGSPETNMVLEYLTGDKQIVKQMDLSFPSALYNRKEYFRPPNHFVISREKLLPIEPGRDVLTLLNVAQLFEPYYLWEFDDITYLQPIGVVGGMEFELRVYGDLSVDLGLSYTKGTLDALVWFWNSVPIQAELSLNFPKFYYHNLTTTELHNVHNFYLKLQSLPQALLQQAGIPTVPADIAYRAYSNAYCTV